MAEFTKETIKKLLESHMDKEFVRRILRPNDGPNPIQNPDGSISTHLMAAEVDSNGNWYAFPTIISNGMELIQVDDPFKALFTNIMRNEFIAFGKDEEGAREFARGAYKLGSPLEGLGKPLNP